MKMAKLLLNIILITIPLLSLSQDKIYPLCEKGNYRIYVDSDKNHTYLNVVEFISEKQYFTDSRRYEILRLEPDSCCIKYVLNGNQYCYFNASAKCVELCENRTGEIKCVEIK